MYQIQLLNKISPSGLAVLPRADFQCGEDVQNPDGIIVRSASLHDMPLLDSVRVIARAGVGYNNIPVERCNELGIAVFYTPGANANAVKELTVMGLLLSARKIYPAMQWVQSIKGNGDAVPGMVEKGKSKFTGPELMGKKLGVIGLGKIGAMVCNIAQELGMEVYGYDPYLSVDTALELTSGIHHAHTLQELYRESDFITLHVPLNSETRGMINASSINTMKHGVRILNFSRGELVDTDDMIAAVDEKQVYCYITDFPNDKLLGNYGVIALPHLGASTPESENNCAEMAAKELREYLENGNVRNSVNLPDVYVPRSGRARVTVIHRNEPNMISQISGVAEGNINNLTNNSKNKMAYTIMDLDIGISRSLIDRLNGIDGVIRVTAFD